MEYGDSFDNSYDDISQPSRLVSSSCLVADEGAKCPGVEKVKFTDFKGRGECTIQTGIFNPMCHESGSTIQ